MPIEKWISFSLDGVWAEWCFRRHARRGINVDLAIFPKLRGRGTPFVSESARVCQYNFDLFRTLSDAGLQNANDGSFEIFTDTCSDSRVGCKSTNSVSRVVPAAEKSSQATRPATKVTLACGWGQCGRFSGSRL